MDHLAVYRAIDKYDRLGADGVKALLTTGRRDQSGHFTPGCGMSEVQADLVLMFLTYNGKDCGSNDVALAKMRRFFMVMATSEKELNKILPACEAVLALPELKP